MFFDEPPRSYPRRWSELSFDAKQFFAYHLGMMVLFVAGGSLSVATEILIVIAAIATMIVLSLQRRRAAEWHWPGVGAKGIFAAIVSVAAGTIFLFVVANMISLATSVMLPFALAALGMIAFNSLTSLRFVRIAQADFEMDCRPPSALATAAPPTPATPTWKRMTRAAFAVVFMLVWLDGLASFYFQAKSIREGSPFPNGPYTEPVREHGHVVYVTSDQRRLNDLLQATSSVGIPIVIATAFALHFLAGVRLFPARDPW